MNEKHYALFDGDKLVVIAKENKNFEKMANEYIQSHKIKCISTAYGLKDISEKSGLTKNQLKEMTK